jgi:predicted dienelactone hydrolase
MSWSVGEQTRAPDERLVLIIVPRMRWRDDHESRQLQANALRDDRIKAAVVAAPGYPYAFVPDSLSQIAVPIQLWSAGRDDRVPGEDVSELRRLLPVAPEYHSVEGAGHFAFLSPCNTSAELCTDALGFDRASFHETFNKSVVDFFADRLRPR